MAQATTSTAAGAANIRAERDRFVALAFCWADVVVELDDDEKVVYCAGPLGPLVGHEPQSFIGHALMDLVAEPDRPLVSQLMGVARKKGRIEGVTIRLKGPKGPSAPLAFAGYRLEDLGGHFFLALRMGAAARGGEAAAKLARDAGSGLYDAQSFAAVVTQRLKEGGKAVTEAGKMTLIELPGYGDLKGRLKADDEQRLLTTMGAFLRANSVDGDSAARIGDDRYGLIHSPEMDVTDLQARLGALTRDADPEGKGVKVEAATVEVDAEAVSEEDLANGLVYAINRFRKAEGSGFSIKNLTTNISTLVGEATKSVNTFKRVVAESDFDIAMQPIIDVQTGEIHHYEALARFRGKDGGGSPYETITFAEETGLIQEFDLAMARKVVAWLAKTPRNAKTSVAVNVSGASVGSLSYMAGLRGILADNVWMRGRLLFEITESSRMTDLGAADKFIQNLRTEGYTVCLDDFGAGAANFQYLSTMQVDVVKLDGSAVRNAQKAQKGRAFLRSLVALCRELGVATIAEMVDDEAGLKFIRECGVQYVQGYLFGKPSPDLKSFDKFRVRSLFPSWRG